MAVLAAAGILAGALALRLWGIRHGLPYVYNADENAHFVPRAVGMFGHSSTRTTSSTRPRTRTCCTCVFDLRFGGRAGVGEALAADRTAVFETARIVAAVLGTGAVALLAWAGAPADGRRGRADRGARCWPSRSCRCTTRTWRSTTRRRSRPVCLALLGVATIYRHNGYGGYAVAGLALGLACATKYTAGILVLTIAAAALATPVPGPRLRGLVLAGVLALAGFLAANPYALLDVSAFREGLSHQSEAAGDGGGKLGLSSDSGVVYYLGTVTWGLGWLPALAALGGAIGLALRDRRLALVLVPAPLVFLAFMGTQDRFFARWLLPVYPLLCLLAAWAVVAAAVWLAPRLRLRHGHRRGGPGRAAVPAGARLQRPQRPRARPRRHPAARPRVDGGQRPDPLQGRHRAVPAGRVGGRRAERPRGHGQRPALEQVADRCARPTPRAAACSASRTTSATPARRWSAAYARGGYCWVVTGSTQYGRAFAEPREVPDAIRYYAALERDAKLVYEGRPDEGGKGRLPFSLRLLLQRLPARLRPDGARGAHLPALRRPLLSDSVISPSPILRSAS